MFTSVDIDQDLFNKAWRLSAMKTKKAFFEETMRVYIRLHEQAEVRALRGRLEGLHPSKPRRKRRANPR